MHVRDVCMHTCEVERTKHTGGRRQSSGLVVIPWKITQVYRSPEQREGKSGWEISVSKIEKLWWEEQKGQKFYKGKNGKGGK